jgi:hypothetical protein
VSFKNHGTESRSSFKIYEILQTRLFTDRLQTIFLRIRRGRNLLRRLAVSGPSAFSYEAQVDVRLGFGLDEHETAQKQKLPYDG